MQLSALRQILRARLCSWESLTQQVSVGRLKLVYFTWHRLFLKHKKNRINAQTPSPYTL